MYFVCPALTILISNHISSPSCRASDLSRTFFLSAFRFFLFAIFMADSLKSYIFAENQGFMDKKKLDRETALARFQTAKEKKRKCLAQLEKEMKEAYEKRTGQKAGYFFAL